MSLSERHEKREPFGRKGSKTATFYRVCSFLYILGVTRFL